MPRHNIFVSEVGAFRLESFEDSLFWVLESLSRPQLGVMARVQGGRKLQGLRVILKASQGPQGDSLI